MDVHQRLPNKTDMPIWVCVLEAALSQVKANHKETILFGVIYVHQPLWRAISQPFTCSKVCTSGSEMLAETLSKMPGTPMASHVMGHIYIYMYVCIYIY